MCMFFDDMCTLESDDKYIIVYNNRPLYLIDTIEDAEKFSLSYTKKYFTKLNMLNEKLRIKIIMKTNGFEIVRYNPFYSLLYDEVIMSMYYIKVKQFKNV